MQQLEVKLKNKLIIGFILIFIAFTIVVVAITGLSIYRAETDLYTKEAKLDLISVAKQIEYEISLDEDEFYDFVDYIVDHRDEIDIDIDFDDWTEDKEQFDIKFNESYPGKTFGYNVSFDDLSPELKNLFAKYNYEYYMLIFEKYRETFNLPYTYFIIPTGNGEECLYLLDVERIENEDKPGKILLFDVVAESHEDCPTMWKTWEEGEDENSWDVFDNEFGKTYSYYKPLVLKNNKIGLICVDVDINNVNESIVKGTLSIVGMMSLIMIISIIIITILIDRIHLRRIRNLKDYVYQYADTKDVTIAKILESHIIKKDELSQLGHSVANMITEIDSHIKKIKYMDKELDTTKRYAHDMEYLANMDALSGLKNRTAFSERKAELEDKILNNNAQFSLILIDLNYLKHINDTYGHDKGDIMLETAANLIDKVFGHEDSYRIGGDEFMIVCENENNLEDKISEFDKAIKEHKYTHEWEKVSFAMGVATYDKNSLQTFDDVFEEADKLMYERKKQMKAERH